MVGSGEYPVGDAVAKVVLHVQYLERDAKRYINATKKPVEF